MSSVKAVVSNWRINGGRSWVADVNGTVVGLIALRGNEVGAIFVEPEFQGNGVGRALMDKAKKLHGNLEVDVFQANSIGRRFYSNYGFKPLLEKNHEETGNKVLRLKFTANK